MEGKSVRCGGDINMSLVWKSVPYKINNARKQQRQHRIKWLHNARTPLRQLPIHAAKPFCNRVYDAVNFTFSFIYVFLRSFVAVYLRATFSVCLCAGLFHYFIGVWEPVAVFIYIGFNFPVTAQKITIHMALIKKSMTFWHIQYFMRVRERRTPVNVGRIIRVKRRSGGKKSMLRFRCGHEGTTLSRESVWN